MNPDTCAALVGIFSVLLLVVPLEGRSLRTTFRRRRGFLLLPAASLLCSILGLVVGINGVYYKGLILPWESLAWAALYIDLGVTAVFLFALVQQDADDAVIDVDEKAVTTRRNLMTTWSGRMYLRFTPHGRGLPKPPEESPTTD